jgi:hypothetical protein
MRTKTMFTVSDINGSKQYNLTELIQRFMPWILGFAIVNIAIGAVVAKFI